VITARPRLLSALAILCAAALAGGQEKPGISFIPAAWDLGALLAGTRVQVSVAVRNSSAAEAEVSFLPTCTCLSVEPARQTVAPGATARFTLGYDSGEIAPRGGKPVQDQKSFIVRSGLPGDAAPYYFMLTAAVWPAASASTRAAATPRPRAGGVGVLPVSWYTAAGGEPVPDWVGGLEPALKDAIELQRKDRGIPLLAAELAELCATRRLPVPGSAALRVGDALLTGADVTREALAAAIRAAAAGAR
jgi:hypothetical protein